MSQNYLRHLVRTLMLAGLLLSLSTIQPFQLMGDTSPDPQGVITYADGGPRRIYAFPWTGTGTVTVNHWDGSRWLWADHGTPPGPSNPSNPGPTGVITYKNQSQPQRIYAFFRGAYNHLNVYYWDGAQWRWADQGAPTGSGISYYIIAPPRRSHTRIPAVSNGYTCTWLV